MATGFMRIRSGVLFTPLPSDPSGATEGDFYYNSTTDKLRIYKNSSWYDVVDSSTVTGTNTGDVTLGSFGSSPNANGASLSGQVLTIQPASGTQPGAVSTTTQTFGGNKTFANNVEIDGALDHDGSTLGFYGVTPTTRATGYTISNVSTDRAYDANNLTIHELADVLGTLINDLKLTGIIG